MNTTDQLQTLISLLFATKCGLDPRHLYPENYSPKLRNGDTFDFIVIGGGSAGSVVASRLSEIPEWNVLLLEAGDYPTYTSEIPFIWTDIVKSNADWDYRSEPSDYACLGIVGKRCTQPRGKSLGGSSSQNAMIYLRGLQDDYNNWEELGNPGWNWSSVEKYFQKIEKLVGLVDNRYGANGPLTVTFEDGKNPLQKLIFDAAREAGYPVHNTEEAIGYFNYLTSREYGTRCSTSKAYISKIQPRNNLFVALNAFVTKFIIEENIVRAVEVVINENTLKLHAVKEFILSAGTFNSPQILMLSGIGPENHLKELSIPVKINLPVGKNLQDHFTVSNIIGLLDLPEPFTNSFVDALNYCINREGVYAGGSGTNIAWTFNTEDTNSNISNIQINHYHIPRNSLDFLRKTVSIYNYYKSYTDSLWDLIKNNHFLIYFIIISRPKSRGEILLRSSNPYEKPLIYMNYLSDENGDDLRSLIKAIENVNSTFSTPTMRKLNARFAKPYVENCLSYEMNSSGYWECFVRQFGGTGHHASGTCKMGLRTDPTSVVDPRLKLHHIENLRIIDASIAPVIVNRNTNGPTIMIGEKGADLIKEDWLLDYRPFD